MSSSTKASKRRYFQQQLIRIAADERSPEPPLVRPEKSAYGESHFSFKNADGSTDAAITIMIHDATTGTFYTGTVTLTVARTYDPASANAADLVERQIRVARLAKTLVVERTTLNAALLDALALPDATDAKQEGPAPLYMKGSLQ